MKRLLKQHGNQPPQIIDRVRQLHGELATGTSPDELDSLRKQLDVVMVAPHEKQRYSSLGDGLREVAASLRANHPRLAGAVQGLIDELVAAGL